MEQPLDLELIHLRPGVTRIEASAGTGKTYAITGLVLRLLLDERVKSLSEILVVTFTEAATSELKTRIRGALYTAAGMLAGEQTPDPEQLDTLGRLVLRYRARKEARMRIERALEDLDRASIFTIHGFCRRLLEQMAFESGASFGLEVLPDPSTLLDRAARDYWHATLGADDLFAQLAVEKEWKLTDWLEKLGEARRFPDTRLEPPSRPLQEARSRLVAAIDELKERWDAHQVRDLSERIQWNKPAVLKDETREATLAAVAAIATGRLVGHLSVLADLTSDKIESGRNKGSAFNRGNPAAHELKQSKAIRACETVLTAADGLEGALLHDFCREVGARFDQAREEQHLLSYEDLLRRVASALDDPIRGRLLVDEVHRQYTVALIDEFQDTDPIQYKIFSSLFDGQILTYIGDPKQAIYGFRGADVRTYLEATRAAADRYTLDANWRSTPDLVEAVNALFEGHSAPFVDSEIAFAPVQPGLSPGAEALTGDGGKALQFWFVPPRNGVDFHAKERGRELIAEWLVQVIRHLTNGSVVRGSEPVRRSDIGVLVRKHHEADFLQKRLRRAGIHSVISKSGNVLESKEAADLLAVLRAVLEPHRSGLARAALATDLLGLNAVELFKLSEREDAWQARIDQFRAWQRLWFRSGFTPMMAQVAADERLFERLLAFQDGERRATNLRHMLELVHEQERAVNLSPEALSVWLAVALASPPADADTTNLRLESDDDAVKIATMHAVKGLQYPVVFALSLWDTQSIDQKDCRLVRSDRGAVLYTDGLKDHPDAMELALRERLAEDMRLAYVALTRAQCRCYVAWGALGKTSAPESALGYLLHGRTASAETALRASVEIRARLHDWEAELSELVQAHQQVMSIRRIGRPEVASTGSAAQPDGEDVPRPELRARSLPERASRALAPKVITSYSSLTAAATEQEPDPDADPDLPSAPIEAPSGAFAFAKGAATGLVLHKLIETLDFGAMAALPESVVPTIESELAAYDLLEPGAHAAEIQPVQVVRDLLHRLVTRPLPGADFRLADVPHSDRLNEWRFHVPIRKTVSLGSVAAVFSDFGGPRLTRDYVPLLVAAAGRPVEGFLTGSADLIFRHDRRWYLADWKSNHLGYAPEDYRLPALRRVMMTHHYVLQYHIYLAALHRFLQLHLPGYRYENDFGGVWYVFLRGIGDEEATGFYFDQPDLALVEAIAALFEPTAGPSRLSS